MSEWAPVVIAMLRGWRFTRASVGPSDSRAIARSESVDADGVGLTSLRSKRPATVSASGNETGRHPIYAAHA